MIARFARLVMIAHPGLVGGLKSQYAPIKRLGKFTDKDDAIAHAKELWRSGAYYSVSVGTFCHLTSDSDNAIYVCQDIVYSSKGY